MLFVNTRPTDRAAALSAALSAKHIAVFELPLLELEALPWSAALAACYQQLLSAQVIVVVSPTAVQIGMQYLLQSGIQLGQLQHITWIAVGEKTAQHLAAHGIDALIPEVETSEGMLSLAPLRQLASHSTVAFWRGEGGRQFMMQHLQQLGIQVINCVLYQRRCPAQSTLKAQQLRELLQQPQPYHVLISSEASWLNWCTLFQQTPQLIANAHYVVLGERLYQLLLHDRQQQQLNFQVMQLSQLEPARLIDALVQGKP